MSNDYIHPEISPRIISNISSLYTDTGRIFMEFIDNAFDSAEEFYDPNEQAYSKKIKITIRIVGSSKISGKIIISDNCVGMNSDDLTRIINSIGNSNKKAQGFTNGQFGFGIYSFMAACEQAQIISSKKKHVSKNVILERKSFDADRQEDVNIKPPNEYTGDYYDFNTAGTTVVLSKFDNFRNMDAEVLVNEISSHFEGMLERNNLEVKVINQKKKKEYVCTKFPYLDYEGEDLTDLRNSISYIDRDMRKTMELDKCGIKSYIKITTGKVINKPVILMNKGRRISEIHDLRSFKSKNKSLLWNHDNVTGYIEVDGLVSPTIARTDFKKNENTKALYGYLVSLEDKIEELVKSVNEARRERHYHNLENELNKALSALAKLDTRMMRHRTELISGNEIALGDGSEGQDLSGEGGKDKGNNNGSGDGNIGEHEGDGIGPGDEPGDLPGGENSGDKTKKEENPFSDDLNAGRETKKSGFNITIAEQDPPITTNPRTGKEEQMRSTQSGDEIIIYRKHPDFINRIKATRTDKHIISQRLITYLAGEMTIHYKHTFHEKGEQPTYGKWMFQDLTDSMYFIENCLKGLKDKNLNALADG